MRKNSISAPQYGVSGAGRMAGNLRATKGTVSTLDNGGFKVSRKSSLQDHQHGSPQGKRLAALKEEGRPQHATAQQHQEAAPPVVLDMSELYPNRGSVRLNKKKGQEKEGGKTVPRAESSLGQAWKAGGQMTRSLQSSFANLEASSRQRNALLSLLLIVGYLFVGVGAYNFYFEDWGMIKAIYFGIVTLTSVGYGDLAPTGQEGRLFTMFFGLTGISLVALALSQLANYIAETRDALNAQFKSVLVGQYFEKGEDAEGPKGPKPGTTKAEEWKSYLKALFKALVPIFIVNFIGAGLISYIEGTWTVLDTWYYAVITSATIGFGDLHPTKNRSCLVAIFYIPASVLAVGNGIRSMTEYQIQKAEEQKRMEVLTREFVYDDLFEMDANGDGTIDRHEFTIYLLKLWGIVDDEVIAGIGKRFEELDTDGSGALTREDFAKDASGKKPAAVDEEAGLGVEERRQFVQLRDQLAGALVATAPTTPRRSVRLQSHVLVKAMHTPPASPRAMSVSHGPSLDAPPSPTPFPPLPSPQRPQSTVRLPPSPSHPPQTSQPPISLTDSPMQAVPIDMEDHVPPVEDQVPPPPPTPISDFAATLGLNWKLGI